MAMIRRACWALCALGLVAEPGCVHRYVAIKELPHMDDLVAQAAQRQYRRVHDWPLHTYMRMDPNAFATAMVNLGETTRELVRRRVKAYLAEEPQTSGRSRELLEKATIAPGMREAEVEVLLLGAQIRRFAPYEFDRSGALTMFNPDPTRKHWQEKVAENGADGLWMVRLDQDRDAYYYLFFKDGRVVALALSTWDKEAKRGKGGA